jgi:hypothetical protein
MLIIRAAAAELPRIGVAEAAAILLAIERLEPENSERAARRWLAKLCENATPASICSASPKQPLR